MNRTARDKSERHFLYFITVLVLILLICVFCNFTKWMAFWGLSSIFLVLLGRGFHLSGRPEGDISVIKRIGKDE